MSRRAPQRLTFRLWAGVVLPVLSLVCGVIFSLAYWGYAWSVPGLDARVHDVKWSVAGTFTSDDDGSRWRPDPIRTLETFRSEPAPDSECCEIGRIVTVLREQHALDTLAAPSPSQLSQIESEVLSLVPLAEGNPGYVHARQLSGLLALGDGAHGPVAFVSFTGGEVSNDHHPAYEVFFRPGKPPLLLSSRRWFGDVAGVEGLSAFWFAGGFYLLGALISGAILLAWEALRRGPVLRFLGHRPR